MTKFSVKSPVAHQPVKDWFLPAIEANGSVEASLDAVLSELRLRSAFITSLKYCLVSPKSSTQDMLTLLSQKIKVLGQTLEARLGMLALDRPQAWFRPSVATHSGPFATHLLQEPVFCIENIWDYDQLRADLIRAWTSKDDHLVPLLGQGPCLWRTLLTLNKDHERLCILPDPFSHLRLDILPEGLTEILESRPLRAFLLNVKHEVGNARLKLNECYERLLAGSEAFWAEQKKQQKDRKDANTSSRNKSWSEKPHERVHQKEQRRVRRDIRSIFLAPADYEALTFMGFEELPSHSELRLRYLTMAKKLHPDRQAGKDEGFKLLSSAYERLLHRVETAG